jgi:hypothetical protein
LTGSFEQISRQALARKAHSFERHVFGVRQGLQPAGAQNKLNCRTPSEFTATCWTVGYADTRYGNRFRFSSELCQKTRCPGEWVRRHVHDLSRDAILGTLTTNFGCRSCQVEQNRGANVTVAVYLQKVLHGQWYLYQMLATGLQRPEVRYPRTATLASRRSITHAEVSTQSGSQVRARPRCSSPTPCPLPQCSAR